MDTTEIEKQLIEYINTNDGISSAVGKLKFSNSDRIGQGGNGLVYLATINEQEIAIKFLIADSERKLVRFKSEYFNTNYVRDNTGKGNNTIHSIIKLENNDFLMDERQLNIRSVWGFLKDDVYDDILLLEIDKSSPYLIDGNEYNSIAVIENKQIVPYDTISSGFFRYDGKVHRVSELNIQERFVGNDYKVIAIAPFHSCTIIEENDKYLRELQAVEYICIEG